MVLNVNCIVYNNLSLLSFGLCVKCYRGNYDDDDEWEDTDEEGDFDSEGGFSGDEHVEGEGREFLFMNEETKSRFTEYSLSSSVMRRNEQLTLLDDRFEKVLLL